MPKISNLGVYLILNLTVQPRLVKPVAKQIEDEHEHKDEYAKNQIRSHAYAPAIVG